MLNKMLAALRRYEMVSPGDTVICAVSGGADSMALLWGMYLLREKLGITLEAAHFDHNLRGEESRQDADFVRKFCEFHDIPLHFGEGNVIPGKKGLEAAARDARYAFLRSLNGTIATAHTADDNAETVLMHLLRGSGLRGLGGVTPRSEGLIRPMLDVTRAEVEAFLSENYIRHVEDSSNGGDEFLRNRLRHHVMPLLAKENPKIAENLSQMALRLRLDEEFLSSQANSTALPGVESLKNMPKALRNRALENFLKENGVKEPEDSHIAMAESLVFSDKPSARASFPGGITLARNYDRLEVLSCERELEEVILPCPGEVLLPGLRVSCVPAEESIDTPDAFTVSAVGTIRIRCRKSGDSIRLSGGSKSLKKLFIDRKIPAARRQQIPVACDDAGILGVYTIGANWDRTGGEHPVTIRFENTENKGE